MLVAQTSLIKSCFSISAEHGLRRWSVTCDRTSTNLNTFKNLGRVLSHDYKKSITNLKRDYQKKASSNLKNISPERKSKS